MNSSFSLVEIKAFTCSSIQQRIIFTFLDELGVLTFNNHTEREASALMRAAEVD